MDIRSSTFALVGVLSALVTVGSLSFMPTKWSSRAQVSEPIQKAIQAGNTFKLIKLGNAPNLRQPGYANLQFVSTLDGWLAEDGRLWSTKDGGRKWELVFTTKPDFGAIYQIQFVDALNGWILAEADLYHTRDGGNTWEPIPSPVSGGRISFFEFTDRAIQGWVAGAIYDTASPESKGPPTSTQTRTAASRTSERGFLSRTQDGGKTWELVRYPSASEVNIWAASSLKKLLAISLDMFYLNNDHWAEVDHVNSHCASQQLVGNINREHTWPYGPVTTYFVNDNEGWLSFANGFVAKTSDGGKTWCDLLDPKSVWPFEDLTSYFKRLYFSDPMNGWGLDEGGALYRTGDGGRSWTKLESDVAFDEMYFLDADDGWAISSAGVFKITH